MAWESDGDCAPGAMRGWSKLHQPRLGCIILSPPEAEPRSISQPQFRQLPACLPAACLPGQHPSRGKRVSHCLSLVCPSFKAPTSVPLGPPGQSHAHLAGISKSSSALWLPCACISEQQGLGWWFQQCGPGTAPLDTYTQWPWSWEGGAVAPGRPS